MLTVQEWQLEVEPTAPSRCQAGVEDLLQPQRSVGRDGGSLEPAG